MLLPALLLCAPAEDPGSVAVMAVRMTEEVGGHGRRGGYSETRTAELVLAELLLRRCSVQTYTDFISVENYSR